jgi:hypothetical protein
VPESEDTQRADSSPAIAPVTKRISLAPDHPEPAPPAAEERVASEPPPAPVERPMGFGKIALITAAAAALSYGVVRWAVTPVQPAGAPSGVAAAPPPSAARPAAVKVEPVEVQATTRDLELPAGIPVAADKGLLEIEIGGQDAIYVDGVFVGLGPTRRVPLPPGRHEIEVRSGGVARSRHVADVRQTRRVRLEIGKTQR